MKNFLLIIIALGWSVGLFAQINPEYLLELLKGTTAEMNAVTPVKGVLMYNTDDDKLYCFDGSSWLAVAEDDDWTRSGSDQYSAVSGNVGVGTVAPQAKLDVEGLIRSTSQVFPTSGIGAELAWDGAFAVLRGYDRTNSAYQSLALSGAEVGTYISGSEKMIVNSAGDIGMGTHTPVVHLNNNTSSIPANLEISTTEKTGVEGRTDLSLFSDLDGSNPANIFLQGKLSNGKYGWATWSFRGNHSLAEYKDWVDFGLNDGTATKEQVIRMNVLNGDVVFNEGSVGIGITNPSTKLHVMGDIQLGGSDTRLIRFRNLANNDHASLGELNGGLVLSGHSSANVTGHEHMFIDNNGNVGVGTITPSGRLHISSGTEGDAKLILEADTDDNNEDDNPLIVFKQDGGVEESAIEQMHNSLHFRNSISGGGLVFDVGTANGYQNATEAMRVASTGEVGIGTPTPSEKLDIQGNMACSGQLRSHGPNYTFPWMKFEEHQWGNSTVLGAGGNTILGGGEFAWAAQPNFTPGDEKLVLGSDYNIVFFTNTQSGWDYRKNVMTLTNTARVGINTDAPTVDLDVNGKLRIRDIPAGSTSQWLVKDDDGNIAVQASDFRLKKNITTIKNSLDKVLALDGKYFDWKVNGRHDIGFIAQDVEKILPELVSETDDGYKALNYPQITAVLVNAVKELKKENDILRKRINQQEFGAINATIKGDGQVEFANSTSFKVLRLASGAYVVQFENTEEMQNYSVNLSTSKTILANGDPVYINLVSKTKDGFEVKIQSVDKDRVMNSCDVEWAFDIKSLPKSSMVLEASIGSVQE